MPWIHAVVDVPDAQQETSAAFWSGVFGWPVGRSWAGHPELQSVEPGNGAAPYVHLQRVGAAPRVHLDLESAAPDEIVARALDLGTELVAEQKRWRILVSPGGLPFCVLVVTEHRAPGPVTWSDGHRSRAVQVCVDSPRSVHDREVAFWRALLGGRWVGSDAREFAGKWHNDVGSPLQLLFQRLDEPDGAIRAHLDLGTDDLDAEVGRIRGLGATDIGPGRGWHALRDPSGLAFCVTANSPETTVHRDLR